MTSTPSRLTPPIIEGDTPDPVPPIVEVDPIAAALAGMKLRRAELARTIEAKIGHRATLMTEIAADRDEAKRLDRFLAAEKPRTRAK